MAKQGMKRMDREHEKKHAPAVPEISGKAKSGKEKARPLIAGFGEPVGKVYHSVPHKLSVYDNDLAIENLQNDFDMTPLDIQDMKRNG